MTSDRCVEGKYWDRPKHKCELCETKYSIRKGFEFTANCGWSDEQHQTDSVYIDCSEGTFNDGSHVKCKSCSSCVPPEFIATACTAESDSICCRHGEQILNGKCGPERSQTTVITTTTTTISPTVPVTSSSSFPNSTQLPYQSASQSYHSTRSSEIAFQTPSLSVSSQTGIYICLGILSAFSLACLLLVIKWRRTNRFNEEFHRRRSGAIGESLSKTGIDRFQQSISYNIIKETGNDHIVGLHFLAPEVQNAPLKIVLNNLDVLEELVFVLDPDISGAKNTRHLAAQCSFSFAWINYAYSMKDHKSPLVAVLEGVVTKNPDWTVGHFAELLTTIGRNDALEILAKLPAGVQEELM